MTTSITQTKLSSETLNRIDRVAAILCQGDEGYQQQIAITLVQLATLGYYDGKQDALMSMMPEPDTFPGSLNWEEALKQPRKSEVI